VSDLACNIELKARLSSLAAARETAVRIATQRLGHQRQTDTYFHSAKGRLKLRETSDLQAQLVWYERPDDAEPKASHYYLVPVVDPGGLKQALTAAVGVRTIVVKNREIFLYHNVRIHLDEVAGLGTFLEFEAVLAAGEPEERGQEQLRFLKQEFGIMPQDLLARSYSDLLDEAS
jgi:adenylate cyclase class 2